MSCPRYCYTNRNMTGNGTAANRHPCPMEWMIDGGVGAGTFGGIVGFDHYYTNQGMPCVDGRPQEFERQDAAAIWVKSRFPRARVLQYRITSAVPVAHEVRDQMLATPDYFLRFSNGTICENWQSSCFNDPTRINSPAHHCPFEIRASAYNWLRPGVREWFIDGRYGWLTVRLHRGGDPFRVLALSFPPLRL